MKKIFSAFTPLDVIEAKIAGIGAPALIPVIALGATGYVGAAAVATVLAALVFLDSQYFPINKTL